MEAFPGGVFNNRRRKPNWLVYLQAGGNDDREEGLYVTVFRELLHASLRVCVGVSELLWSFNMKVLSNDKCVCVRVFVSAPLPLIVLRPPPLWPLKSTLLSALALITRRVRVCVC